jgi:hypothetical protein
MFLLGLVGQGRAEQPAAADAFQRPLRSRFQARLSRSVAMTSGVKGYLVSKSIDGLFSFLSPDVYPDHGKRRRQ